MKRALAGLLLLASPAWSTARGDTPPADSDVLFTLSGPDGIELPVSPEDLDALPSHREHVAFQNGHGDTAADYEGISLYTLLLHASAIPPGLGREHARLLVRVTGRDGYVAVVAVGEIDPELEGKDVMLGRKLADTGPVAGALRMLVPGDKHGARDVRDVVRVEVR